MILSGAGPIILNTGAVGALPDFSDYPPRLPHGIGGRATIALFLLHAGAALYHHLFQAGRLAASDVVVVAGDCGLTGPFV